MTYPIPDWIAWPAIVVLAAVAVAHRILVHHSTIDRLINRSMGWPLVGLVLYERNPWPEFAALVQQVALGCVIMAGAAVYGLAQLWAGADPRSTWVRQRGYNLVFAGAVGVLFVLGTSARQRGQLIDETHGWVAIAFWAVVELPILASGVVVWRVSRRELAAHDSELAERLIYLGILCATVSQLLDAAVCPLLAALAHLGLSGPTPTAFEAYTLAYSDMVVALCLAVPTGSHLAERVGWNRTGRYCRQLRPLWRDLTAAVPEVVLPRDAMLERDDASLTRFYRMTVEIRDALLHLKRYFPDTVEPVGPPDVRAHADYLAHAIAAKAAGMAPRARVASAPHPHADHDTAAELQHLLDLSREWLHARSRRRPAGSAVSCSDGGRSTGSARRSGHGPLLRPSVRGAHDGMPPG
jgi:hypothetical protein